MGVLSEMNKKGGTNWNCFFMVIGFLFSVYLVGSFVIGNSAGEDSWGYVISHNSIVWIVVGVLLFIAIMCAISESKKEKLLKNQEEEDENE